MELIPVIWNIKGLMLSPDDRRTVEIMQYVEQMCQFCRRYLFTVYGNQCLENGCAMALAVSCQPLNAEAQV